jgi:glutamine synthetase
VSEKTETLEVISRIRESGANKVKLAIADLDGVLRGKYVHPDKFASAAESGFGFCNVVLGWDSSDVCYDNVSYTGWHTGYPDANVHIDLGSYRSLPWDRNVPFFMGHFVDNEGKALEICPRQLLRRVVGQAEAAGFHPIVGCEFEWCNFKETPESIAAKGYVSPTPLTPGMFGYSLLRAGLGREFFHAIADQMGAAGIPIEGLHTETGPGVYEAAITKAPALEAADRAVLFKTGVKEIAYQYGIIASFMARWNNTLPGCSGHLHQSLRDSSGNNLFYGDNRPYSMSPLFESYLAGLIYCMPDLLCLFAPTVNSYKRLVEGYWAPTSPTWGVDNRTCALRVIPGSRAATRIEVRTPGSDCNPYLSIAGSIAAGLYGIRNKLKLGDAPIVGNSYRQAKDTARFSTNLFEAANRFQESKVARELFGDTFVEHYAASRIWEWRQYQSAVTDWEIRRYFEII